MINTYAKLLNKMYVGKEETFVPWKLKKEFDEFAAPLRGFDK